jgi:tRNA (guanine37-N1)-methyltransferase
MWRAKVLTLFPEMFPGPLGGSLAGRALDEGVWSLEAVDIRAYARDKHRSVDDTPLGGGPGMVLRPDVVGDAVAGEKLAGAPLIYLTPRGRVLDQARARELAEGPGATLLCGRFEGVDQRVVDAFGMEELSIGDFVLSGGELAAMIVLDACVRLLPGVMGAAESLAEESFERGLLEYPQYTRPALWRSADGREWPAPEVLLSGHHEKVRQWRLEQAKDTTRERRPDLYGRYEASAQKVTKGTKS